MKLKCIKGISTTHFVVCLQGDVVELYAIDENEITVKGVSGWCVNQEICLTANEIAACFYVLEPTEINEQQLQDKLAVVKENITHLVDYYDQNNFMDMIPDYVWGYILAIEKSCNIK